MNQIAIVGELTVGKLKEVLQHFPDDAILADLRRGNEDFKAYTSVKRLMLLEDNNTKYLTINSLGSHFTGNGDQSHLQMCNENVLTS